ncbi:MAG TPA: MerR family transcriptional regulator [Syntrophomonadaceae bacterium]|nr:MerR family transcriptional regulator [Syntrophomonadaceae bacterium]HPR93202.1 MerR family transcriptional regulator [Syntrophomonadaceae bacterium]
MKEIYYKISEAAEILSIEQHTLRYLENSLGLRINRNDRGDRLYSEADLDTLKLIIKLKEKGLNTTAIKMALENTEQNDVTEVAVRNEGIPVVELVNIGAKIIELNEELLLQNKKLEQRITKLEEKIDKRNQEREEKIDKFLQLWKNEQEDKGKPSWFSWLRGK